MLVVLVCVCVGGGIEGWGQDERLLAQRLERVCTSSSSKLIFLRDASRSCSCATSRRILSSSVCRSRSSSSALLSS